MDEVVIRVLFFAKARELVKLESDSISFPTAKLLGKDLLNFIVTKYPALDPIANTLVVAADEEYIQPDQLLDITNSREIAIIPPLSGG